jgi:hypothetical protein
MGGMYDLCGIYSSLEEAQAATARIDPDYDWWHIYGVAEHDVVAASGAYPPRIAQLATRTIPASDG